MGGKMFNKNRTGTMPRKVLEAKRAKAQNRSFEREEKDEYDDEVDTCMFSDFNFSQVLCFHLY